MLNIFLSQNIYMIHQGIYCINRSKLAYSKQKHRFHISKMKL